MRFRVLLAAALLVAFGSIAARTIPSSYDLSIKNILISEGGARYTNHPADPGGPTKYGITLKDVRLHINPRATAATVKALTYEQATTIYRFNYWENRCVRADDLPAGVDYSVADYGVNAGVGRSGVVLKRLLHLPGGNARQCAVTDEMIGMIGQRDPKNFIAEISEERRRFYRNLIAARPSLGVFRKGWMARVDSVEKVALRMAGAPAEKNLLGDPIEPEAEEGPGKAFGWEDVR